MAHNKILILGVTASGKSRLAFDLARELDGEIISFDSMKVYRRMDIGTAKPPQNIQQQVKYHLVDVVEPSESFSVATFLELADKTVDDITSRGKTVIASGGTALYIKTFLYGLFEGPGNDEQIRSELKQQVKEKGLAEMHKYLCQIDPVAAENIHPNDEKRIIRAIEVHKITGKPISSFQTQFESQQPRDDWLIIGIRREKQAEIKRMNARVKKMIESGLVDEVRELLAEDKPLSRQAACAIGYAEIIEHLQGKIELEEAIENIKKNTRRFAKSQRTWFKTFQNVNWLDIEQDEQPDSILQKALSLL